MTSIDITERVIKMETKQEGFEKTLNDVIVELKNTNANHNKTNDLLQKILSQFTTNYELLKQSQIHDNQTLTAEIKLLKETYLKIENSTEALKKTFESELKKITEKFNEKIIFFTGGWKAICTIGAIILGFTAVVNVLLRFFGL